MKYSNFIFHCDNKFNHRFERNFRSLFDIIILNNSQSVRSNLFSNAFAHVTINQMSLSDTMIILLLNLFVTNITLFSFVCEKKSVKTKSIVKV